MTKRAREQIFTANVEEFTLRILRFHGHEVRAQDVAAKSGDRQTAFFFSLFTLEVNDFRVYEDDLRFRILASGHVDHGHAQAHTDLRSRQAHTLRGVHGSEHVLGELLELGIKFPDLRSSFFQDGIAVFDDRIDFPRRGQRWRGGRRRRLARLGFGGSQWFRTPRFVGHSCRNSAAARRADLPQIFAEKHPPGQGPPWPRPRLLPPGPRTSRSVRRPLGWAPWSPYRPSRAPAAASRWASDILAQSRLRRW